MKSAILIEQVHYNELIRAIEKFENFMIGKKRLIELRKSRNVDRRVIESAIKDNSNYRTEYNNLLENLKNEFIEKLKQGFE